MPGPAVVALRFVLSTVLVLLTFNPLGVSYFHYAKQTLPAVNGLFALATVLLLIAWVVLLRATFQALGAVGVTLMLALIGALIWVGADAGLFDLHDATLRTWLALGAVSFVFGLGLSWGGLRRKSSGQVPVVPPAR